MAWKVPLFKIDWTQADIDAIASVIQRGSYWSVGPEIVDLEKQIADFVGCKFGVAFNSGTSALHASLLASGIGPGDEVIVPSFTFIATANVVALTGATPVFADIERDSYGLDPEDVMKKLTPKTKAIIPVHYGGGPCRTIQDLTELAQNHDLVCIEDAAESLGAKYQHRNVGSFGDASVFSFCQNKVITCGEGGVVITDSAKEVEHLHLIRSHGRVETKEGYFASTQDLDYVEAGYNYRLSSISAALALSQFHRLSRIVEARRAKAAHYTAALSSVPGLRTFQERPGENHVYQLFTIELDSHEKRDAVQRELTKAGVMTKVYFEPVHLKTAYRRGSRQHPESLPVTEEMAGKVLTLPLFPSLSEAEQTFIESIIRQTVR